MMNKINILNIILLIAVLCTENIFADLVLIEADEIELPYNLSKSNYINSPNNYTNSVNNYANSSSNYSNSSSNYNNSSSNYNNGKNGDQRILLEENGEYLYLGYYVITEDNIINFFLNDGTRIFYSPAETGAIFGSKNGNFCGTIASMNGKIVLVITETGQKAFLKNGVVLNKVNNSSDFMYPNGNHWIEENIDYGKIIILEDGSIWEIDILDRIKASLWLEITMVDVVKFNNGIPGYDYILINKISGEKVSAKYMGIQ